jgi:hypothetical protein
MHDLFPLREGGYEPPIVKDEWEVGLSKLDEEEEGAVGLRGPGLLEEDVLNGITCFSWW